MGFRIRVKSAVWRTQIRQTFSTTIFSALDQVVVCVHRQLCVRHTSDDKIEFYIIRRSKSFSITKFLHKRQTQEWAGTADVKSTAKILISLFTH